MYFNWVISSLVRTRRRYTKTWSDTKPPPSACGPEPAWAGTPAPVGLIVALLYTPRRGRQRGGGWGNRGKMSHSFCRSENIYLKNIVSQAFCKCSITCWKINTFLLRLRFIFWTSDPIRLQREMIRLLRRHQLPTYSVIVRKVTRNRSLMTPFPSVSEILWWGYNYSAFQL